MPKEIKYEGFKYYWDSKSKSYFNKDTGYNLLYALPLIDLNKKVEIIEEQQDIDIQAIEELDVDDLKIYKLYDTNTNETNDVFDTSLVIRINELIRAVKQLDRREER